MEDFDNALSILLEKYGDEDFLRVVVPIVLLVGRATDNEIVIHKTHELARSLRAKVNGNGLH